MRHHKARIMLGNSGKGLISIGGLEKNTPQVGTFGNYFPDYFIALYRPRTEAGSSTTRREARSTPGINPHVKSHPSSLVQHGAPLVQHRGVVAHQRLCAARVPRAATNGKTVIVIPSEKRAPQPTASGAQHFTSMVSASARSRSTGRVT